MSLCLNKIIRLKKRYDAMQTAAKKTGSVLYFAPLRVELNNCFGALKDISPNQVYSNCKGMEEGNSSNSGDSTDVIQPSSSKVNEEKTENTKKRTKKSNYITFIIQ